MSWRTSSLGYGAGMLAAFALASVCAGCSSAGPKQEPWPRLTRVLPRLGPSEFVQLDEETRPAVMLRPGEIRRCRMRVSAGSRLHFSWGIPKQAPSEGWLMLKVRVGGQTVYRRKVSAQRRDHWWQGVATLPESGYLDLEFEGAPVRRDGSPVARMPDSSVPWLALGSPRLYSAGERRARRVLVWISQDTVRADHLSAYGYARKTSPTLERLAAGSVLFENGVAAASWTLPSLAAQMTSRLPSRHGATLQDVGRDTSKPTIFEVLAGQGFAVFGVTGNHFVSAAFSLAQGFDALWYTALRADDVNRLAVSALDEWDGGDLALFVHYMDPHFGYNPPAPFHTMFTDPNYAGTQQGHDFGHLTRADEADVEQVKALYDGEIAFTDQEIQRLLDALRERVPADRLVLVYSADHGDEFLDHGHWGHGRQLYQELIHVPFAIRTPDCTPRRVKQVVSLIDLAPTVLDVLGIASPPTFEGRSLAPGLQGGPVAERPVEAETELTRDGTQRLAIRDGRLKYLLAVPRAGAPLRVLSEELYDLRDDPAEQRNLMPSPQAVAFRKAALAYLESSRAQASAPNAVHLDAEAREKLKALGYIE
jgi:arylsulfatase A-like enzyme